jgi:hypothetical protein
MLRQSMSLTVSIDLRIFLLSKFVSTYIVGMLGLDLSLAVGGHLSSESLQAFFCGNHCEVM